MLISINKAQQLLAARYIEKALRDYKKGGKFKNLETKKVDLIQQDSFPDQKLVARLEKILVPIIPRLVNGEEIEKKIIELFTDLYL